MYSKSQLRKMFRIVMNENNHNYNDIYSLTGMCVQTIRDILFKSKWMPTIQTLKKVEDYISTFQKKSSVIVHTTEETYVSTKEETIFPNYEEKADLKIRNMLKDTFIESYNKLLNPLGYEVKISIEPMVVV